MNSSNLNRRDFLKLLGVAPLALLQHQASSTLCMSAGDDTPNVLILVFDTLSARNMSLYGYARNTTPNLERFAQRATIYHHHYAGGNFTSPGTASLLTGVYPWSHRAIQMRDQTLDRFSDLNIFSLLANSHHSFAYTHNIFAYTLLNQFRKHISQLLKISDLALFSASLAEKWANPDYFIANESELLMLKSEYAAPGSLFASLLDREWRLSQTDKLYQAYRQQYPRGVPDCRPGKPNLHCYTVEDTFDWLRERLKSQSTPFLGYIHVNPPHAPYNPPRAFIGRFKDNINLPEKPEHHFTENNNRNKLIRIRRQYDEFIAYADSEFGRLYDYLSEYAMLDNTCVIVTSDHGEMLERGIMGHVTPTLYEPIVRVPLLIAKPGQTQRQDVQSPTSAVDLLPTLLHLTGQQPPSLCEGQVLPGFSDSPPPSNRSIFVVEAKQNPKFSSLRKATIAMIEGQYKLIYYTGYPGFSEVYELYDLEQDPEELVNIYSPDDPVSTELRTEIEAKLIKVQT